MTDSAMHNLHRLLIDEDCVVPSASSTAIGSCKRRRIVAHALGQSKVALDKVADREHAIAENTLRRKSFAAARCAWAARTVRQAARRRLPRRRHG